MSFNKKFFATGGIVASSAECTTDTADKFGDGNGIALYNLDYDASDASGNYDGTPTNVTFGVGGNINYGARFNGSTSTIDIDATATTPIDFSSEVFSVSLWINPHSFSTENTFFAKYGTGGVSSTHRTIIMKTDTSGRFVVIENDGSSIYTQTSTATISANTYTFFAYTRSGSTSKIYINNNSAESQSRTNTIKNGSTQELTIGGLRSGVTDLDGDLDQVRIFSSTLTDAQVSTLYAEQACVHTGTTTENDYQGTTAAYYKFDNSAEDEKGNYDGTETDIEYRFGRYGQAAVFNGSSSKIDTSLSLDTNNVSGGSISLWFKTSQTTPAQILIGSQTSQNGASFGSSILLGPATGASASESISVWDYNSGTTSAFYTEGGSDFYQDNNWHHLVITSTSSSKNIYIDGISQTISFIGSASAFANLKFTDIQIGATLGYTGTNYFDGKIDQVRIYSTVLDFDQVTELYNEKPETDTSNFKTVLYEGTSTKQYISNVGYNLDAENGGDGGLVWVKQRTSPTRDHRLYDTVRGINPIYSSRDLAQGASNAIEYDANGFFFAGGDNGVNENAEDYVAWVWKGGGDAVLNEVGDIDSQVSNSDKGFSISLYTNNGSASSRVGHGLTVDGVETAPEVCIIKKVSVSASWHFMTTVIDGSFDDLILNDTAAKSDSSLTAPTTTTFAAESGATGQSMVCYSFVSVSGYSKIGTYEGDNTTSGTTINVGFKPSFLLIKNIDTSGNSWHIFDSARNPSNPVNLFLKPNQNAIEGSSNSVNFENNGFELLATYINTSSDTYLYMAFK